MKITPWETIKAAVAHYWRIRKLKVPKMRHKSFETLSAEFDRHYAEFCRLNDEGDRIQAEARMKGK